MFANTKIDLAALGCLFGMGRLSANFHTGVASEICRTDKQAGQSGNGGFDDFLNCLTRCEVARRFKYREQLLYRYGVRSLPTGIVSRSVW